MSIDYDITTRLKRINHRCVYVMILQLLPSAAEAVKLAPEAPDLPEDDVVMFYKTEGHITHVDESHCLVLGWPMCQERCASLCQPTSLRRGRYRPIPTDPISAGFHRMNDILAVSRLIHDQPAAPVSSIASCLFQLSCSNDSTFASKDSICLVVSCSVLSCRLHKS